MHALPAARRRALAALLLLSAAACTGSGDSTDGTTSARDTTAAGGDAGAIRSTRHATLQAFGHDTLSSGARILTLMPASTGDDVAFTFADSVRGVRAGLGIIGHDEASSQLLWPDSVTDVWWTGPRSVAFTSQTGAGVRMIVDVRAESLSVRTEGGSAGSGRPTTAAVADSASQASAALRARARAFVDSLHPVAPSGGPGAAAAASALRWEVTGFSSAPGSSAAAAFQVVSIDGAGRRTNPSWYLALGAGRYARVVAIDSVTGPAWELPERAAGWGGPDRFYYARGLTLWEAHLRAH